MCLSPYHPFKHPPLILFALLINLLMHV
ncbi:hypothetical protein CGLO_16619 [Colletotrichum gloeosporioides Cg-14]|uniref:Uncharacterized protein n=1 Tax=Colletotrichum gloeosporioides (strain Cg-14) TaxID=1237896 RepID=T0JVN5_COLGC|nr:hypothetical protein CGLO_16619 [Colletotrichum gloeosporioides Cg-14]